jgi:hypothetical protein
MYVFPGFDMLTEYASQAPVLDVAVMLTRVFILSESKAVLAVDSVLCRSQTSSNTRKVTLLNKMNTDMTTASA